MTHDACATGRWRYLRCIPHKKTVFEWQTTRARENKDPVYVDSKAVEQYFSTAGQRHGTGSWHQLYRAARGSPGICHFSFL